MTTEFTDALLGGAALGGIITFIMAFLVFILIGLVFMYFYFSLCWMVLAKKLGHRNAWLAWIPLANICLILEVGGFSWAWVFLLLVPVIGWTALIVLGFIATWRVYEKRKYPGILSLIPLLAPVPVIGGLAGLADLVILGMVEFMDRKNK
ncbi:MAG: hypothetical protein KKF44_06625 [Nanoarchaeota archaeon]|nr:hypothetical protein [Nanoarchaeota archaeon]